MKKSLLCVFLLLTLAPPMLLCWLGVRMVRDEEAAFQAQRQQLYVSRLESLRRDVSRVMLDKRRILGAALKKEIEKASLHDVRWDVPESGRLAVVDARGRLLFPTNISDSAMVAFCECALRIEREGRNASTEEAVAARPGSVPNAVDRGINASPDVPNMPNAPFDRTQRGASISQNKQSVGTLAQARGQQERQPQDVDSQMANQPVVMQQDMPQQDILPQDTSQYDMRQNAPAARMMPSQALNMEQGATLMPTPVLPPEGEGWQTWFWGEGLGLVFWKRDAQGRLWAADISRARLMADVIAALPDGGEPMGGHMCLMDAKGSLLYQWGQVFSDERKTSISKPDATLPLDAPLGAWRLTFQSHTVLAAASHTAIYGVLGAVVAIFCGLACYFYREATRELRLAGQRVSFVNQVSHELKTPLTNIRLYAELLDDDIMDAGGREKVEVILSESDRLGRLIANVLAYARQQRGKLRLHPVQDVPDVVISRALAHFEPAFQKHHMPWTFDGHVAEACRFDPDVLEQILNNLFSNAVKYAHGAPISVTSMREGNVLRVRVQDHGRGIPASKRETVFIPFMRLDDRLTEGVSGTGIGLSVSRELAILHGGNVTIESSDEGALFLVEVMLS